MVINENNSHINSFVKGMNSDMAYDQIGNDQYVYAKNVRITKNLLIGGATDYSSLHEGIVTPVLDGIEPSLKEGILLQLSSSNRRILNICTVDNMGTLITTNGTDMFVYRFNIDEVENKVNEFGLIWSANGVWKDDPAPEQISAVLYKELENVIKLYIATGKHPIISFRVDDESISKLEGASIDNLINNRILPLNRVFIEAKISGRLLTSQVLYTYRCYNKYGNTTQLAPLTNKIQVIDASRSKEIGNAENTETSVGFTLSIDLSDLTGYERIQVYRLQYIKSNSDADVSLIYDDKIKLNNDKFVLNDVGLEPLLSLSMEEFSAMSGLILVPQTIELNQEYMFCANVKDDTIIKGATIAQLGDNEHRYELVHADVTLSTTTEGAIPVQDTTKYTGTIADYFTERGINSEYAESSYDNIFTSSLLRSLRRGETYKYAIIYYDKYGRRTDVLPLDTVSVPDCKEDFPFELQGNKLVAKPIGVKFNIPVPYTEDDDFDPEDIVGCQIVRRSASDIYQKALLQVALARPIRLGLLDTEVNDLSKIEENITKSPYYPTGFLQTNNVVIMPTYYIKFFDGSNGLPYPETNVLNAQIDNKQLYLIFSSEIDFRRDDVLSRLSQSGTTLLELAVISGNYKKYDNGAEATLKIDLYTVEDGTITINRTTQEKLSPDTKQGYRWVFDFYSKVASGAISKEINTIKDVKIPNWEDSFTNILKDSTLENIASVIMKYKSYTTSIDKYVYNNWVSWGKYNLAADHNEYPNMSLVSGSNALDYNNQNADGGREIISTTGRYTDWINGGEEGWTRNSRNGYIGPGPSCFLMTLKEEPGPSKEDGDVICTSICNITHNTKLDGVQSDEQTQYFGFGNYFPLTYQNGSFDKTTAVVFDGDIYITPHEFTTEYKTYNFESADTLQSIQITNYIPLESKVNTFFDYGMNLRNTLSANLLYEPGSIDGVTNQERPAHQYNMVYSDNDASNDIFTLISTDKNETNQFKQRAYYSEMKTNGEFIDNFLVFKPAAFIDVDSKYGEITNLYTDRNMLYYWLNQAFGKFSVNERSLVNDQNSNTIMLGQAGILSRYDYISTKYGMRLHDLCARSTEVGIYWVDVNNKAVVAASNNQAINYGEQVNVQNIINDKISLDVPQVDYDLLNNELICKCLGEELLVFNIKYNMATAIYTRDYDKIAYVKNHMYQFKVDNGSIEVKKDNYIDYTDTPEYLQPLMLNIIINPAASVTKVFDSQQLIPIKRDKFNTPKHILDNTQLAFETDLVKKTYGTSMEPYTDREGNIIYNIPRYMNQAYGNRMRGKWMKVNINNNKPTDLFTISHIITKYRQSYS